MALQARLAAGRFSSERATSRPIQRLSSQAFSSARLARAKPDMRMEPVFQVKLNKTFLEIHDSDQDTVCSRQRSSSDPGTDFSSEPATEWSELSERLQAEQDVEWLSEHMNQIWREHDGESASADDWRPPARSFERQRRLAWLEVIDENAEQVRDKTVIQTSDNSGDSQDMLERQDSSSTPAASVAEHAEQMNPGSLGHPELCPKPCLQLMRGHCAAGIHCDFCHLTHSKRPSHLDKRNRDLLKRTPMQQVVRMIVPMMRDRVQALNLNPELVELLHDMERVLGSASELLRDSRGMQNLYNAMSTLTLRTQLGIMQRALAIDSSDDNATFAWHVDRLRACMLPRATIEGDEQD